MSHVFLATMAMSVSGFALFLLLHQSKSQFKSPLVMLLSCLFLIATGPLIFASLPSLIQLYVSLLPVLFFTLLPSLWFYHEALVSESKWQWKNNMWKHFAALPFSLILGCAIYFLPKPSFNAMFFSQHAIEDVSVDILSLTFFIAVLIWCVLSFFYAVMLNLRNHQYRKRLKEFYSNEHGKTLTWLRGLAWFIVLTWGYSVLVLFLEDRYAYIGVSERGIMVLLVVIVWILAANGLTQRPGFEEVANNAHTTPQPQNKKLYEHSALTSDDLSNIASKLTNAIQTNKAHIDNDLTLAKLAVTVGEPPQYVSQTLSQQLNTTFFDFVNGARIDDAKRLLKESNQSVLDIALATGFNSRSSFYKAFKQFTDLTPSQYRKANHKQ